MARTRTKLPYGILLVVVLGLGAGGFVLFRTQPPPAAPSPTKPDSGLSFEPNAEQIKKLGELKSQLSAGRQDFEAKDAREKENGKLFTYLAATSEERKVVAASLKAISQSYGARSTRKATPDDDLDLVLIRHLQSQDRKLAALAVQAARAPLMSESPSEALLRTLVTLAGKDYPLPTRFAALTSLNLLRPTERPDFVLVAFGDALSSEQPGLVSEGLLALAGSGQSLESLDALFRGRLGREVAGRLGDREPGVRGRALLTLMEQPSLLQREALENASVRLLLDSDPFVRGAATDVVAAHGDATLLSLLLPLTADDQLAEATIVVPGLDDGEHVLLHRIPGRPRVSDCAFYAMQKLARETKAPPLRLSVGASPGATREKPTKNSVALAWFKQAAPSLPPQRAPFPTPPDSPASEPDDAAAADDSPLTEAAPEAASPPAEPIWP